MKAIHAYVRPHMAERVIQALNEAGCRDLSVITVQGMAHGLAAGTFDYSVELAQAYEHQTKVEVVAPDDRVSDWVNRIVMAARTGAVGDGMVFVLPVDDAIRIATGASGDTALHC